MSFKLNDLREPVNSLTHFAGVVLSIPVTIALLYMSLKRGDLKAAAGFFIFGLSLFLLYGASSFYHGVRAPAETIEKLRKIDHMMIFVLIAGTYTPVCLTNLKGKLGNIMLIVIWSAAILGIGIKIFWFNAPRWLSTFLYILMGWTAVFAFFPLSRAIPAGGVALLIAGGVAYTIGGVIYATKPPFLKFKCFGFHEIFHLFVLLGSFFHVLFMFIYSLNYQNFL